jgi:hypothetical protein
MDFIAFLPQFVLYQLTNPFIFIPGILIGWFARTRAQRVGGGVLIAIATTLLSFRVPLPAGGQHVWGAIPLAVIAPLIWVFAVAALKRWMRPGESEAPGSGRLRLVGAIIGTVIGAPLGAAIGAGLGTAAVEIFQISAREGGAGYFVMFLFVLPGIPIGAIIGAIIGYRWAGARKTTAP